MIVLADRTVKVTLEAIIGPYQRAMAQAAATTRQVGSELNKLGHASAKTAQSLQPLGTAMLGVGAGFAAGVGLSLKASIDFEAAMRNVNSIMGQTEGQFAVTSESVRALSRELPQSATNLAQGLYDIASSGFQGADGLEVLKQSATAATAGLTDTATASGAIVGALNAYGLSAKDAADVSDILFATVDKGVISFPELAQGLGEWVGTAHAAGIGLDEASAALATMTVNGINAMEAGTSLNRVILSVISASPEMSAALAEIGYNSGAAALSALGLTGTMQALSKAGYDNITALQALFPDVRGLRGAFALTANDGEKLAEIVGEITDKEARAGSTQRAFAEQSKSTAVQLQLLRNNVTDLAIGFGNALLPVLRVAVDVLAGLVRGFREMPGPLQTLAAASTVLFGVVTLLGGGFLFLLPTIQRTIEGFATLAIEAPVLATSLRTVMIASGGIGLALTVAAAAYALFASHQDDAIDSTNRMTAAFEAFADGQVDVARKMVLETLAGDDLLKQLNDLGIVAAALSDIMTTHADGSEANVAAAKAWQAALDGAVASGKLTQDEADALSRKVFKISNDYANAAGAADDVTIAQGALGDAFTDTAADVDKLNDAIDEYLDKVLSVQGSTDAWHSSLSDLATSLRDNGPSLEGFGASAIENRDAMSQAVQSAAAWVKSMQEQGKSQEEIRAGLSQMAADLIATAMAYGVPRAEAETYANMLLGIPTSVSTTITANSTQAVEEIQKVINKLGELGADAISLGPITGELLDAAPTAAPRGSAAAPAAPTGSSRNAGADYLEAQWRQRMEQIKNRFHEGQASLDEYEASLDEQMAHEVPWTDAWVALQKEKADAVHYWTDKVNDYLTALYEHQKTIEDNMFAVGDLGKDRYLEILQDRLAGLEKYSDEWMAVWREIQQIQGDALDMQLKVIEAYDAGRQFQLGFDQLADQRATYGSLTPVSAAATSTTVSYGSTYNVNQTIATSNPYAAATTANEQMRNYAAMAG